MNYPISQLSSTGGDLIALSQRIKSLAAEANGINSAISGCYGAGGVGGRAGIVASSIGSQASLLDQYGTIPLRACQIYSNATAGVGVSALQSTVPGEAPMSTFEAVLKDKWSLEGAIVEGSLNRKPGIFVTPSFGSPGETLIYKSAEALRKTYGVVKDSYENHGWAYDTIEYGKCIWKGAKAVVKIGGGIVSMATGTGIPMGAISIISGINDLCNAFADATYVSLDAYELVGKTNALKDTLVKGYGTLGEYYGNKELGELLGKLTYEGINVVTLLDSTDKMLGALGKANTVWTGSAGYSQVWGETNIDDVIKNKIKFGLDPDIWIRKMMKVDPSSKFNITFEATKSVYKTFIKGVKLGKSLGGL